MAYHVELFEQAVELVTKNPANPKQADLRRAVSSAYYALFHLLISEATANWNLDSSRDALARMFEHTTMKRASRKITDEKLLPFAGENATVVRALRMVARSFIDLQDRRHIADYDNAVFWSATEAQEQIKTAAKAFDAWRSIKSEKNAQDYLVSLLIKTRD